MVFFFKDISEKEQMKKLNNVKKISEINLSFIKDFVRFHFSLLFWQILSMNIQRLKMFYFKVHQAKLRFLNRIKRDLRKMLHWISIWSILKLTK